MTRHPAKYNPALMPVFADMLDGCKTILDPFCGTGRIFQLGMCASIFGIEIEPEWARQGWPYNVSVGNALALPFPDHCFDGIVTSPAYGNRMADHFVASTISGRLTYRHLLGRPLHPDNAGQLQWGEKYRRFHVAVWHECRRVLKPGGVFVLNIKDHIRDHQLIRVSDWHIQALEIWGFEVQQKVEVHCPGYRVLANGQARVDYESVIKFKRRE